MKTQKAKPKMKFLLFSLTFACQLTAHATMTPDFPRGEELVHIPVPGRNAEVCVIPKHFVGAKYSKKDLEKEKALCALNEYDNASVCPKLNSTNPGLSFYSVPNGMTPAQAEAKGCDISGAEKVAKYKLSTSCSYAPSLLAYYHVSRILGGIAKVPPAVLRTFDRERHLQLGQKALGQTKSGSLINQTWSGLISNLKAGASSSKKDQLLVDAFDQSYGALQVNPSGEEFYKEFFVAGPDNVTRAAGFRDKSAVAQLLKNPKDVSDFVSRSLTSESLQKIISMQDASEMIILDTLLNQQDRFGNIHYKNETFAFVSDDQGQPKLESVDKEDITSGKAKSPVTVKRMILKDNDCGVAKENVAKKANLAGIVRHLDPKTYKRLLKLNSVIDDPNSAPFFTQNMMFTKTDFDSFKTNLKELAAKFKAACEAGQLKLDLDLQDHFSGAPLQEVSCDVQ